MTETHAPLPRNGTQFLAGPEGARKAQEPFHLLTPEGRAEREPAMPVEQAVALYRAMVQNRLLDERMITLQRQGRIGFYIGSIGEEAAILGSCAALGPRDWVFPCYRENGAALWRGLPLQRFVDNLVGNGNDPIQGRQMPNHVAWREGNYASVSSPIGTQIPQAVGCALAAKIRKDPIVALVYFGEGATSSNDFHVGMNFAGVFRAPAVFLCRNNGWAISVPREKQTASESFAVKAEAYGMPGVQVDGNDLFAVHAVTREAVERARGGGGPTLIEAVTYRVIGHSTSDDPRAYRKEEEVEPWRKKDPLERLQRYLIDRGAWSGEQEAEMRARIDEEIKAAIAAAEAAPPPALDSLFEQVYARLPWHLDEQRAEARAAK